MFVKNPHQWHGFEEYCSIYLGSEESERDNIKSNIITCTKNESPKVNTY